MSFSAKLKIACLCGIVVFPLGVAPGAVAKEFLIAQSEPSGEGKQAEKGSGNEKTQTPEEKMQARFPQPVQVGFLIGLPVLDWNDSTIGYVREVVRTPDGKINLIVPYAKWFGWLSDYRFVSRFRRPVPVPIETVAILARQIAALDMERDQFDKSPAWRAEDGQPIPGSETIKIAIQRR